MDATTDRRKQKKPRKTLSVRGTSLARVKPVSQGRHKANCMVCAHKYCAEIEADFVNWKSAAWIATEYRLADRASVYRHAHASGLFEKRRRNVHAALERIIEQVGEVEVTASAIVAAVQA